MEIIKQWIDESDVYMLILGGRYGSVEPSTGISYTELEYDYAMQQGKPLFAVVITDDCLEAKIRSNGSTFMEKENPKELGLFRQKVLENISSFFDDPKDIKLCVHETLADFATNRSLKGWVPADEVVDTKPLFDEISKLSEENRQLRESMLELEKRTLSQSTKQAEAFALLREILGAIDIKIPAKLAGGEETTMDLLNIFYASKDMLIGGVTNQINTSDYESFLFFNVCPKLQVHGLALNEKVAGVRYRRYAITSLGNAFLADIDKRQVLKKKKSDPPVSHDETSPAKTGETKAPTKKAPRSAEAKPLAGDSEI